MLHGIRAAYCCSKVVRHVGWAGISVAATCWIAVTASAQRVPFHSLGRLTLSVRLRSDSIGIRGGPPPVFVATSNGTFVIANNATGALIMAGERLVVQPNVFRQAIRIGVHGRRVWVSDPAAGKIVLVNRDGEVERILRDLGVGPNEGPVTEGPWAFLADGSIVLTPIFIPSAISLGTSATGYYLRVDSTGRVLDTLFVVHMRTAVVHAGGQSQVVPRLDRDPLIAFDPAGRFLVILTADSDAATGKIRYNLSRRDVTTGGTLAWQVNLAGGGVQSRHGRPLLSDVVVSPQGLVWLRVSSNSLEPMWFAASGPGEFCAAFFEPAGLRVTQLDATNVWGYGRQAVGSAFDIRRYSLAFDSLDTGGTTNCATPMVHKH